jgi:hypothetical protein
MSTPQDRRRPPGLLAISPPPSSQDAGLARIFDELDSRIGFETSTAISIFAKISGK